MKGLKIHAKSKKNSLVLQLVGDIDETSDLQEVKFEPSNEVIIDLGGIENINSGGGREWVKWTRSISAPTSMKFINCSPVFIDYVNMIEGFIPRPGIIESIKLPYYCEECELITYKIYKTNEIKDVPKDIALHIDCSKCSEPAKIDVVFPGFFKFLGETG